MTSRTPDPVPPTPENPAFSAAPSQGAPSTHPGTTTPPGRPPSEPHPPFGPGEIQPDQSQPGRFQPHQFQDHQTGGQQFPGHPPQGRPVGRGERRAWNTATAVVGGVGALALLLGGAGTATALAMTQERTGSWTADAAVSQIRVDAATFSVDVSTSPTVDHVEVTWHETGWGLSDRQPAPELSNGVLRLEPPTSDSRWGNRSLGVSVVVPQKAPAASLDISGSTGSVNVSGTFKTVQATTEVGSISAHDVEAAVLDARATTGQVLLDGVRVSDRLDAHVNQGVAIVNAHGSAPKRTSVTASTGTYGAAMPGADYWYPEASQKDFPDPRHPRTVDPWSSGDPSSSSDTESSTPPDPSEFSALSPAPSFSAFPALTTADDAAHQATGATPSGAGHRAVTAAGKKDPERTSSVDADTVCSAAPKGWPCLFLQGMPVDIQDSGYTDEWGQAWRERNSAHEEDGPRHGSPSASAAPSSPSASGSASRSPSNPAASASPTSSREQ
ncbi:DUF4097 family beta strand repeat-containing protein [Kocuria varians]|uniref:DUF4097 family beta strand repeat-containing protein n=2 Tax=Kocuria varians TaxID=1272 RepID=UPI0035C4D406